MAAMSTLNTILLLVAALFIGWMTYRFIKGNPGALSKENVSKSLTTLGVLALLLIGFIALLVVFVRS